MRIAIFHGSNDHYGASRALTVDAGFFQSDGHSVHIFVPFEGPIARSVEANNVSVFVRPFPVFRRVDVRSTITSLTHTRRLGALIKQYDCVVAWTLACSGVLPVCRAMGIPSVLSVHEVLGPRLSRFFGMLAATADAVVCNSHASADAFMAGGGDVSEVIYPYEIGEMQPSPELARASGVARQILSLGRISDRKGHDFAIEVCGLARAESDLDIRLTVAGSPFPGQEPALRRLLALVAANPWVTYVGEVSPPDPLLRSADALLLSSQAPESFGLVVAEAWAVGTVSVVPFEGGSVEAAQMFGSWTYEPRSVSSAAEALVAALNVRRSTSIPPPYACAPAARRGGWRRVLHGVAATRDPGGT